VRHICADRKLRRSFVVPKIWTPLDDTRNPVPTRHLTPAVLLDSELFLEYNPRHRICQEARRWWERMSEQSQEVQF